ncbi:DUF4249 family protein [Maribellus comscasis]|uniref:DUF4249 family protein n=1 Tax=Maribellus comscasis TaxID=2681766 RepID=A0A6I6JZM2_9BACT|nr:DUF4249 family protein [Maribellus comscasis]QGY44633.1 DUF4249 family protein [Maribellus comscasis]
MKKLFIIPFALLVLFACENEDELEETITQQVVEAYLYNGSSDLDIKLSEITPFEDLGSEEETLISAAEVYVTIDGADFILQEKSDMPGHYSFSDSGITIQSEQEISFLFVQGQEEVTAETTVPQKPQNVQLSESEKYIEQITSLMDLTQLADATVEISWDNPDNSYYYVSVKNITDNPKTIDPNDYIPDVDGINTPPLPTSFSILWLNELSDYGTYEIIVYKVNSEYVDLYNTQQQDSRTLNEPLTNIQNGYGIFTAFASDTVYLEIVEP